jgi:hypothetical protein
MKTEVVMITPAMAEKWLKGTTSGNRPIRKNNLQRLIHDMKSGQWSLNGESIVLDDNGNVVDGQHRLRAVVDSGVTIQSVVVRGVDASAFEYIDLGVRRDGGDVLAVRGYQYGKELAAALNVIDSYYTYDGFHDGASAVSTNKYRHQRVCHTLLAEKYADCGPSVAYIHCRCSKVRAFRPPSFVAAMHYVLGHENAEARDKFFESLATGIPPYGAACPTLKITKAYQVERQVSIMKGSVARRYELWRTQWDAFKARFEREQRKPAASLRFMETTKDTEQHTRRVGTSF